MARRCVVFAWRGYHPAPRLQFVHSVRSCDLMLLLLFANHVQQSDHSAPTSCGQHAKHRALSATDIPPVYKIFVFATPLAVFVNTSICQRNLFVPPSPEGGSSHSIEDLYEGSIETIPRCDTDTWTNIVMLPPRGRIVSSGSV